MALDPEHFRSHMGLGYCHYQLGDYKNALMSSEEALSLDSASVVSHANRCVVLLTLGRHAEALDESKWLLQNDPDNPNAILLASEAHLFLGHYVEAHAYAKEIPSLLTDIKQKAIAILLKCIAEKLTDRDTPETEREFDAILKETFGLISKVSG